MPTCNRCAECCKFFILQDTDPAQDTLEYYLARGWTYDPVTNLTWIPCVCRHLLKDNTCGMYADRPEYCKKYPLLTPGAVIPEKCAFHEKQG